MASPSLAPTPRINLLTGIIVTAPMKVQSLLGPGLLENAYEACLLHELRKQGLEVRKEVVLPVVYDGITIDLGYRIDLLGEDTVVVELKCTAGFHPIHQAQLLSYLKLSGRNVGLLINFHVTHLRNGIQRMVNGKNWEK